MSLSHALLIACHMEEKTSRELVVAIQAVDDAQAKIDAFRPVPISVTDPLPGIQTMRASENSRAIVQRHATELESRKADLSAAKANFAQCVGRRRILEKLVSDKKSLKARHAASQTLSDLLAHYFSD